MHVISSSIDCSRSCGMRKHFLRLNGFFGNHYYRNGGIGLCSRAVCGYGRIIRGRIKGARKYYVVFSGL